MVHYKLFLDFFLVILMDCIMGFITFATTIWEKIFGAFSKHRRVANPSCLLSFAKNQSFAYSKT